MIWKRIVVLPFMLLGLSVAGCAGFHPAGPESDSDLAAAARDRLGDDTITSRLALGVTVEQGVATVSGSLRDAGAKARALAVVRSTPGIKGVVDNTTR